MPADLPAAASWKSLRRLPGRSPSVHLSRAEGRARLWVDDRHVVQEIVRSHTQEVRRFAFEDIQTIQFRRTSRGMAYNFVLTALLALTLLVTVAGPKAGLGKTVQLTGQDLVVSLYIAAPFLVLLLVNTLRGPTCRAVLTTALGTQPLPSLSRMRAARRALDEITTRVEAVQGTLTPEEAARLVDGARAPAVSNPPAPARPGDGY